MIQRIQHNGGGGDGICLIIFVIIVMNEYKKQQLHTKKPSMQQLSQNFLKNRYDHIGFNLKKKPKKLIRLIPLGIGSNIETINRMEQDLLRDIRDIDQMLQKRESNMNYIHGFLFASGISKQLIKEFYSALQVTIDAVQDGFYLWRLREYNQNYELVSSKLIHSPRHFPQKLLDKSIENLINYDQAKHAQSVGKGKNRWNACVKIKYSDGNGVQERGRRIKTDFQSRDIGGISSRKYSNTNIERDLLHFQANRKHSDLKQVDSIKSHSNPLELQSYIQTKRSKQQSHKTQGSATDEAPSLEQLSIMLKKQLQIVSIWVPPSTCPQLLGIMSIEIKQKSYNIRYCLIKKYYWYRHSLSRRFFDSILQWSLMQFDSVVQLAIVTSKDAFNTIFSCHGWQLSSWINDNKIKISYSGL